MPENTEKIEEKVENIALEDKAVQIPENVSNEDGKKKKKKKNKKIQKA
jgi:hypothetical protein